MSSKILNIILLNDFLIFSYRKLQKLGSYKNQENVVPCRAIETVEDVQLEDNKFLTQQLRIYEQSRECITPKVILRRNTNI